MPNPQFAIMHCSPLRCCSNVVATSVYFIALCLGPILCAIASNLVCGSVALFFTSVDFVKFQKLERQFPMFNAERHFSLKVRHCLFLEQI